MINPPLHDSVPSSGTSVVTEEVSIVLVPAATVSTVAVSSPSSVTFDTENVYFSVYLNNFQLL